ncbi:WxL protein peptidoglycan domain-containing protein [Embleya sp. NPDC008237]|uniref:WxL protein peptidoglycan domain-containing protein n=1 Tax=Embleya sp. NPDC008237 TaxID=3363978 RepID=UPI0036E60DD1
MRAAARLLCALFATIAPLTALVALAAPARAADEFTWGVQPAGGRDHFVLTAAPGQTLVDVVGVSNFGDKPLTLRVYATDAVLAADGGMTLLTAAEQPKDVGAWIGFDAESYTVAPGKRADIPFRLTVPADASPGDHTGAIVASIKAEATGPGQQRFDVDRRVGARIYLRVDGPAVPRLAIEDLRLSYDNPIAMFGGAEAVVRYRVRNTGNVRTTAGVETTVSGPGGWRLGGPARAALPELLPGATHEVVQRFDGVFPAGRLTADVEVTGNPATVTAKSTSVWAPPWLLLGAITLLLGALIAYAATVLRRRRAAAASSAEAAAAAANEAAAAKDTDTAPDAAASPTEVTADPTG